MCAELSMVLHTSLEFSLGLELGEMLDWYQIARDLIKESRKWRKTTG